MDLSVIVPFVNEYPQVEFTAQSILNELRGSGIAFELLMVDNWCEQAARQDETCRICGTNHKRVRDKGGGNIEGLSRTNPEMRYLRYDTKLSHWNAKNTGVRASSGRVLWFCDAHCVVSPGALRALYHYYVENEAPLNGTLHMPITYLLDAPGRELIYKLAGNFAERELHYSFTRLAKNPLRRGVGEAFRVPCMSTCGMMMSRATYDKLGGWPEELGIYGGGENFINFTLATFGMNVNVLPDHGSLWHYAEKRGYHFYFDDYLRNRMIATLMFGGTKVLDIFVRYSKGNPEAKRKIMESVTSNPTVQAHKAHIEPAQVVDIMEWWSKWTA